MDDLIDRASTNPATLNDEELAAVFVHLIEFPQEDLTCSDLENAVHQRTNSGSYEILRALALYYSDLSGNLFYVGEGSKYDEAYLRALEFCDKALKARDDSLDEKIEKYEEHADAYIERNFAFRIASLVQYVSELKEAVEYNIEDSDTRLTSVDGLIDSAEQISNCENPLQIIKLIKPLISQYVAFTRESLDALPEDD